MSWLLDTHAVLWMVLDAPDLSPEARRVILSGDSLYVSAASWWEIAIKQSLGRLPDLDLRSLYETVLAEDQLRWLPITFTHVSHCASLGFPANGHRDPFDRMLVAQAKSEGMILLSADIKLDAYEIERRW